MFPVKFFWCFYEEEEILKKYYDALNEKQSIELNIQTITKTRDELKDNLEQFEYSLKSENSLVNSKNKELHDLEIEVNRMDVKLDNLLLNLSENYSLTYERARMEYQLDVDEETARLTVNNLKANIKALGEVNTGSIAEYSRLSERYNFLSLQRDDLEKSVSNLLGSIDEMDELMKVRFVDTFEKISEEFRIVFKKLFKGGEGILELTNPNDILNTGIEISALPPGKKLNSIALLSGGEKTLTAISLLFAILNVKPVPFVILDEVEAALDEANVDAFGKYLLSCQDRSQFIIITHKN